MKIDSSSLFSNCLGVFQGGGCKAIAYAGAYQIACKRGVGFSKVAGSSAGAIFAALIACGASLEKIIEISKSEDLRNISKLLSADINSHGFTNLINSLLMCKRVRLSFLCKTYAWRSFFVKLLMHPIKNHRMATTWKSCKTEGNRRKENFKKQLINHEVVRSMRKSVGSLLSNWGLYSSNHIEKTVGKWLREINDSDCDITFREVKLDLYVFSSDIVNHRVKMWDKTNTPDESVAKAVAASCSIPIYFNPVKIQDDYHVDGGLLSNRPDFIRHDNPSYFQTLSFKLNNEECEVKDFMSYCNSLLSTLLQGADRLQHIIGPAEETTFGRRGVNEVNINVGDVGAIDFRNLTDDKIDTLIESGKAGMQEFLNDIDYQLDYEGTDKFLMSSGKILKEEDFVFNQIAFWSYEACSSIYISDDNLDWAWPLFPTMLSWALQNVAVRVFYSSTEDSNPQNEKHESIKRMFIQLGFSYATVKPEKLIRGIFFQTNGKFKCILFNRGNEDGEPTYESKVYDGEIDSKFIKSIVEVLISDVVPPGDSGGNEPNSGETHQLSLEGMDTDEIIRIINEGVDVYENCNVTYAKISVNNLSFLKNEVRSLKFKELRIIQKLYEDNGIELFSPASLRLPNGKISMMTPIVVEKHGDRHIVIKGNARCYKVFKNRGAHEEVPVILVEGAPSLGNATLYSISDLRLSEKKNRGQMNITPNRNINQAVRPNHEYLL